MNFSDLKLKHISRVKGNYFKGREKLAREAQLGAESRKVTTFAWEGNNFRHEYANSTRIARLGEA